MTRRSDHRLPLNRLDDSLLLSTDTQTWGQQSVRSSWPSMDFCALHYFINPLLYDIRRHTDLFEQTVLLYFQHLASVSKLDPVPLLAHVFQRGVIHTPVGGCAQYQWVNFALCLFLNLPNAVSIESLNITFSEKKSLPSHMDFALFRRCQYPRLREYIYIGRSINKNWSNRL